MTSYEGLSGRVCFLHDTLYLVGQKNWPLNAVCESEHAPLTSRSAFGANARAGAKKVNIQPSFNLVHDRDME